MGAGVNFFDPLKKKKTIQLIMWLVVNKFLENSWEASGIFDFFFWSKMFFWFYLEQLVR